MPEPALHGLDLVAVFQQLGCRRVAKLVDGVAVPWLSDAQLLAAFAVVVALRRRPGCGTDRDDRRARRRDLIALADFTAAAVGKSSVYGRLALLRVVR